MPSFGSVRIGENNLVLFAHNSLWLYNSCDVAEPIDSDKAYELYHLLYDYLMWHKELQEYASELTDV